jgi:phage baseplate assembly protein W
VSRRSIAELDLLERRLGRDLQLQYLETPGMFEDAELARAATRTRGLAATTDIAVIDGIPAATQLLANRLKTQRGELAPLGHPEYGSRHHELIGEPNTERTRNLVKLYVLQALRHEPRIAEVLECTVAAGHHPPRDIVRIDITVRLIDQHQPLNLVVPFSLEGAST